jgi:hypothetical protein
MQTGGKPLGYMRIANLDEAKKTHRALARKSGSAVEAVRESGK